MKTKITIIVLIVSNMLTIYFMLNYPHQVTRLQSAYQSMLTTDVNNNLEKGSLTTYENDKIITQYEGVVISKTKNTVTIKNNHDDSLVNYNKLYKINPVIQVGVTVSKGQTLGRVISN